MEEFDPLSINHPLSTINILHRYAIRTAHHYDRSIGIESIDTAGRFHRALGIESIGGAGSSHRSIGQPVGTAGRFRDSIRDGRGGESAGESYRHE